MDINNPLRSTLHNTNTAVGSFTDQPDLPFRKNNKVGSYPLDKVFILGDSYKIVAKITTKKVLKNSFSALSSFMVGSKDTITPHLLEDSDITDIPAVTRKEIFSKYDKGIKAGEWHEITPENIAKHIAKRLHCSVMVDALCGYGGNTIQFAKYCDYVFGIDIEPEKTLSAQHNAHIYNVGDKIDFITVDFLKLRNLMGDVVFLGPSDVRIDRHQPYSIFKHAEPDLRDLLAKSLEISYSIALKLPGDTDLEELSELFNVSLERYEMYSKRFCMEIEQIMNSNGEVECLVIYFGECSSIGIQEENEAIYEYLALNESPEWRNKYPPHAVANILRVYGTRNFFTAITRIQQQSFTRAKASTSLFNTFLDDLVEKNVFTKNSLRQILEEPQPAQVPNTHAHKPSLSAHINHLLTMDPKFRFQTETRFNKDVHSPCLDSKTFSDDTLNLNGMDSIEEGYGENTQEESSRRNIFNENAEHIRSPSDDVSELNVSSYSVNSSYLKESNSEASPQRSSKKSQRSRGVFEELNLNDVGKMCSNSLERIDSSPRRRSNLHKRGSSQPGRLFRGCDGDRQQKRSRFEATKRKVAEW